MTQEEMERTMQFIVEQQAKNTVGLDELKEAQVRTTANIEALSKDVRVVTRNVDELTGIVANLTDSVRTMEVQAELDRKVNDSNREEFRQHIAAVIAQADTDRKEFREKMESMRVEMRGAFDNLILSNEVTRDLANRIGELAVNTSKRVTRLENEISPET
jgi:hypothetical protein